MASSGHVGVSRPLLRIDILELHTASRTQAGGCSRGPPEQVIDGWRY